ncbi:MAG: phytanoyl-CoA dioxygenase family protein [Alphaproteobacteria bacterium]
MTDCPLRLPTPEEIETFERDGVVCIRGAFEQEWIERLRLATDDVIAAPGRFGATYGSASDQEKDGGTFFGDLYVWTFNETFADIALNSPAARIAGTLMGASKVNLFYDHLLVKEPGSAAPTPWHHDLTYWCVDGWRVASVWIPFDTVDRSSGAVEYVRGSHRWDRRFQAQDFIEGDLFKDEALEAIPDIEADRADYDIVSFEVEPGDCIIHHALTLHGAPGNASTRRRRALAIRYAGDGAVYTERKSMSKPIRDPGLRPGDPLDCELFPVVWRQASASGGRDARAAGI